MLLTAEKRHLVAEKEFWTPKYDHVNETSQKKLTLLVVRRINRAVIWGSVLPPNEL